MYLLVIGYLCLRSVIGTSQLLPDNAKIGLFAFVYVFCDTKSPHPRAQTIAHNKGHYLIMY